ncbi:4a-hydroxytetrahydrobiopterin dehydratase [Paenibacillus sacheonensis]|uniref:4a-hydroxytetrahydrobiopterin dehydratase n=1 Tax=Paenibacillus sacheonensis TaxID=742054 RepID=A0A7X4YRX1_9BACL|nr:4a-hydroxytetrahydrobiopterin dehydratase [Paenibacillus sacheonensis]MBM7567487.1 4a-hydroxytetrahydrobiopterin dehydratase [Paenibacillus sacheonensis]NBC71408.1 4a-hydroxytetrahydrobiopterin dehydratase [Paenibacillus sacheonensis]
MGKREKMTAEAVDAAVASLEGWERQDEKWIAGSYRFVTFPAAIAFVGRIADIAEELNHHPFIGIDYKKVTLRLTTWHAGGLTELDIQSAERYNEVYKASIAGNR